MLARYSSPLLRKNNNPSSPSRFLKIWLGLIVAVLSLVLPMNVLANGGTPIYNGDTGNFNVYLLISPSPPVPTVPAHLTMIITKKGTDTPVTAATVLVEPTMPSMAMPETGGQRFIQTPSRPNQYDVDVPVTMEGEWTFKLTITDPQYGTTSFTANAKVEKPDAPWPIIIAILIVLPVLAGLTWFFLFRGGNSKDDDDEDEEDDEDEDQGKGLREVKVGK
ncbi:MAG: FixH family protein [Chloroflexi bacterium]|nr:FixH family protein [Chloroflexota bacterium]OJV92519.1 MAG: hypothetical protein BGO39_31905 [Chloroflexi bacterium 54-19]